MNVGDIALLRNKPKAKLEMATQPKISAREKICMMH